MSRIHVDVLILGAGFGGSLLAAILAKNGRRVALVDRAVHPRFAIGESSTPLADATLAQIANQYGLRELLPLTQYKSWKRNFPELGCGVKTGFSYFGHRTGQEFLAGDQLLVAASSDQENSDTHWLRSDVDEFLYKFARDSGAHAVQGAKYALDYSRDCWIVEGKSDGSEFAFNAPFIVDATGAAGEVLKFVGTPVSADLLQTVSSALFAHFANVPTVATMLSERQIDLKPHPFCCDASAVHHVLDDGWMWQLRFDDNIVSAGILLNGRHDNSSVLTAGPLRKVWDDCLRPYPFLLRQFQDAEVVRPESGIRYSGRLQRISEQAAGHNWAALAGTAGFIDPLHSTGIAHTLLSVRRLAAVLSNDSAKSRTKWLARYSENLLDEIHLIDALVEGCYAALPSFRLWSDWCMLYFAAVTSAEQVSNRQDDVSFLLASDVAFGDVLLKARQQLQQVLDAGATDSAIERFEIWLRTAIRPWNHVGLLDASVNGMYSRTAAPS